MPKKEIREDAARVVIGADADRRAEAVRAVAVRAEDHRREADLRQAAAAHHRLMDEMTPALANGAGVFRSARHLARVPVTVGRFDSDDKNVIATKVAHENY